LPNLGIQHREYSLPTIDIKPVRAAQIEPVRMQNTKVVDYNVDTMSN